MNTFLHNSLNNPMHSFGSQAIDNKFIELRALIDASENPIEIEVLSEADLLFRNCLMENLSDGVAFIDAEMRITHWNKSIEQLSGLSPAATLGNEFTPDLVGMMIDRCRVERDDCPIAQAIQKGEPTEFECTLSGRSGREVIVSLRVFPVKNNNQNLGCVLLASDHSVNFDLRRQLSDLQNATSLDPLTRVANRAKFEEDLVKYVKAHKTAKSKFSLVVCDLDFFKMVNDTFGHNIGDQALVAFAQTLKKFVRSRDMVARYGGEEFVIIYANCDEKSAAQRAEQIRMALNNTPQAMLDGKTMSASFGVSELREDDDTTDLFVRADQALYTAKQNGRNRVEIYVDSKNAAEEENSDVETSTATGIQWRKFKLPTLISEEFRTATQSGMLAEKLRGYITETKSKILKIEPNYASLSVIFTHPTNPSKRSEFRVDVELFENENTQGRQVETFIRFTIFKPRQRLFGRVHEDLHARLMTDLRRYFMITDDSALVRLNPAATSSGRE